MSMMSKELINRIRKQREGKVTVGSMSFIFARPTDVEFTALMANGKFNELGAKHVIGWDAVTENDVVGGGSPELVAFDKDLWSEMYSDRPDLWTPVSTAILEAYQLHTKAMEDVPKN